MAALSVVDNSREHSDEIYGVQAQVDIVKTVQSTPVIHCLSVYINNVTVILGKR